MAKLESLINPQSEEFNKNLEAMSQLVNELEVILKNKLDKENAYLEKANKKGKLLPHKRLSLLLDPGSYFLELWPLGGYQMNGDKDGSTCGGNIITGVGQVSGRQVLIIVWNFAIRGGTINSVTNKKIMRLQEMAFKTGLPIISLSESGGGDLAGGDADPWGAYTFIDAGVTFAQQAMLSAAGNVQICVAHGNATAGGAYHVALSDYIVLVKNQTQMFLAGPPLLKAATGEITDAETLGGADMHASISGTGEYLANDDAEGIRMAREVAQNLKPDPNIDQVKTYSEPLYSNEELLGIVPADPRTPYDVRDVIARIADASEFYEFSAAIDQQTICGHIDIKGTRCGVIGNNGPITPKGAQKAAQFILLCDQSDIPVIFLQNTTGFLVGVDVEQAGQVKHGAKLLQAVANLSTPKITIILGNAYGAGNYAMGSRALTPDFVFTWPSGKQAVMGGAQAAKVMEIVQENKMELAGIEMTDEIKKQMEERSAFVTAAFDANAHAFYTSARLMDDAVIDPRDTREIIALSLDISLRGKVRKAKRTSFGIPRY